MNSVIPIIRDVTQFGKKWREERIVGFVISQEYFIFQTSSLEHNRATIQTFIDECRVKGIPFSAWWDEHGNWHFEIVDDKAQVLHLGSVADLPSPWW